MIRSMCRGNGVVDFTGVSRCVCGAVIGNFRGESYSMPPCAITGTAATMADELVASMKVRA